MMALRAWCIALPLSISLIACQGATTNDGAHSDLVGAWGLVSWRVTSADGETTYPFGETPEGQIIYSATGQMSAQLMYPGAEIGDLYGLDKTQAIRRVARTFFAYYGTYSVDAAARTVTHHVQGSLRPGWVGTDQLRGFELLNDDRMALTAVLGDAASSDTNFPGSNILMWKRLRQLVREEGTSTESLGFMRTVSWRIAGDEPPGASALPPESPDNEGLYKQMERLTV